MAYVEGVLVANRQSPYTQPMQWPTAQTLFAATVVSLAIAGAGARNAVAADNLEAVLALAPSKPVSVGEVVDAKTLRLGDGREVRLAGIRTPNGQGNVAVETALRTLIAGQTVRAYGASETADRHGRIAAHVVLDGAGLPQRWVRPRWWRLASFTYSLTVVRCPW